MSKRQRIIMFVFAVLFATQVAASCDGGGDCISKCSDRGVCRAICDDR